jgi:hypothetical protein
VTSPRRQHQVRTFSGGAIYISDAHRLIDDYHDFHEGGPVWAAPDQAPPNGAPKSTSTNLTPPHQ